MFYNDPIDDFLEQTRDSARNRTRENRPVSSIEGTPREFRGTGVGTSRAQREMAIANALFPEREGLDDSESERLTELQLKGERLEQPNEHRSLGTAASPNNPFSLDTRGLSGAISRGAASFRDRRDERRLDEIAPELRELAQRQQAAAQSSEDRRDYMRDRVTQVIDDEREFDQTVERDEAGREHDREMQGMRGDQAIEREGAAEERQLNVEDRRHEHRQELAQLENELSGGDDGMGRVTSGDRQAMSQPFRNISSDYSSSITEMEQDLNDTLNILDADIQDIEEMDSSDPDVRRAKRLKDGIERTRQTSSNVSGLIYMMSRPENYNNQNLQEAVHDFHRLYAEGREHEFDLQEYINTGGESGEQRAPFDP